MTAPRPAPTGADRVGQAEFLDLLAVLSALNAIAIDVMLPAFGAVRDAFGLQPDATEVSWIVTVYLAGLGIGQYVYGPITDAYGRKPVLYTGVLLYLKPKLVLLLLDLRDLFGLFFRNIDTNRRAGFPFFFDLLHRHTFGSLNRNLNDTGSNSKLVLTLHRRGTGDFLGVDEGTVCAAINNNEFSGCIFYMRVIS